MSTSTDAAPATAEGPNTTTSAAPRPPPAPKPTNNKPWVESHRPSLLSDVVAHDEILSTLRRLMFTNSLPHLLFYGPAGTGKTSTIQAACRELYGTKSLKGNVLELNASDDRGIDVVRNVIKDFASTGQIFFQTAASKQQQQQQQSNQEESSSTNTNNSNKASTTTPSFPRPSYKMVILDEADQMSGEAQAALRRVIEQYTRNVRFCILCNHVNKIIPAVQSRCTRFRFSPVKQKFMMPRLEMICKSENAEHSEGGLAAAFKLSGGDMRRCVNMLQAAYLAFGAIHEESVYRAAGYPTPQEVLMVTQLMMTKDFVPAHQEVTKILREKGLAAADLIKEIHGLVNKMNIPAELKCHCYAELSDIEYNLSVGASESIAVSSIIAVFQLVRAKVTTTNNKGQQQQQPQKVARD